jgi:2-oxo-3-hexenedioate decarboxylase
MLAGLNQPMADTLIQDLADDIALGRPTRSVAGTIEDVAQAYDIQDELRSHLGVTCGRKIAMNAAPLMAVVGVSEPIVGHIVGEGALPDGTNLRISDYVELALEPEFAAVVGQDIPAGTVLTSETLRDYVSRFSMAFEILDRRSDEHPMHAPTFIVNNVFSAGVVLADAVLDMDALEKGTYEAKFTAAGEVLVSGSNTAPQDPIEACVFVLNHFTGRGETIKAGEVILCGAHHRPMVTGLEGTYEFSLSSGEAVSLSISL